MTTTRIASRCISTAQPATFKLLTSSSLRSSTVLIYRHNGFQQSRRTFSSTPSTQMKEFFPEVETTSVRKTPPAWAHPVYTEEQMNTITISHREARTTSDRVALAMVRLLRWGLDFATGYKHDKAVALGNKDPKAAQQKYGMTEKKYLIRNVFLESIAGVPGAVAGILRHLHSMRRMKRDMGWIETLWEESYNERMHLLIFLKMSEPGLFMRLMVLGAQGVMFNSFFLAYLISPRTCHRFVGYIEEEATLTYTREIADLDAGRLPNWAKMTAPQIAIDYYNLPEGKQSVRDMLMHIRADEAKHREVNHTLGNLDQKDDPNPFVSEYKDTNKPHPSKGIEFLRPKGWERDECV